MNKLIHTFILYLSIMSIILITNNTSELWGSNVVLSVMIPYIHSIFVFSVTYLYNKKYGSVIYSILIPFFICSILAASLLDFLILDFLLFFVSTITFYALIFVIAYKLAKRQNRYNRKIIDIEHSEKNFTVTVLLCFFLGFFGCHRFYVGKFITGGLFFITGGFFGFLVLIDLFTLFSGGFEDKRGLVIKK